MPGRAPAMKPTRKNVAALLRSNVALGCLELGLLGSYTIPYTIPYTILCYTIVYFTDTILNTILYYMWIDRIWKPSGSQGRLVVSLMMVDGTTQAAKLEGSKVRNPPEL